MSHFTGFHDNPVRPHQNRHEGRARNEIENTPSEILRQGVRGEGWGEARTNEVKLSQCVSLFYVTILRYWVLGHR